MEYTVWTIFVFYTLMLLFALIGFFLNDKRKVILLLLQVFSISIFFGFRDQFIGTDTPTYASVYLNQENWIDLGFVIINRLLYPIIGENLSLYFFVICFITSLNFAIAYKLIFEYSFKYINLAYLALYCMPYVILMHINIIRQGLAFSFFVLGITLFFKKRKIGILFVIFSCFIHYSMIMLVVGFIIYVRLKINYFVSICLIIISLSIALSGLTNDLISALPEGYIKKRIEGIINLETGMGFVVKYVFYLVNYLVMIYFSTKIKDETYSFFCRLMGFLLVSTGMLMSSELIANRFLLSADMIVPIIYLYPIRNLKEKKTYLFILTLVLAIYVIFVFSSASMKISFNL